MRQTAEAGCPVGVPDCRTGGRADLQRRHGAGCGPRRRRRSTARGHHHRGEPDRSRHAHQCQRVRRTVPPPEPPARRLRRRRGAGGLHEVHPAGRRSPGRAQPHPRYRPHARERGREHYRERRVAVARNAEADSGRQYRRRFPAPAAAVDPTRRDRRPRGHSGGDGPQPHRQQRDPDLHAARHGCRAARGADRRGRHGDVSSRTHGNRQAAHQCRGGFPGEDRRSRCVGTGGAGRGVQRDDQGWHQPAFRDRGSPSSEPRDGTPTTIRSVCPRLPRARKSRRRWEDRFGPIARGSLPRISISIATVRSHAPRPN